MDSVKDTEHAVEQFLNALGAGNWEALRASATEDFSWWFASTLPYGGFTGGFDQVIAEVLEPAMALYEPDSLTVGAARSNAGEGFAVVEWEIRGRAAANGKDYANFYAFVIEVREGLVSAVREYSDTQQTAEFLWDDRSHRDPDSKTYAS